MNGAEGGLWLAHRHQTGAVLAELEDLRRAADIIGLDAGAQNIAQILEHLAIEQFEHAGGMNLEARLRAGLFGTRFQEFLNQR